MLVREHAVAARGRPYSLMPVDFRYHLASLLAVFCALLIGILLGIALVGDPSLESQLKAFRELRAQNRRTIAKLAETDLHRRAFGKQVLPFLIDSRLQGTRVAVIHNRDFGVTPWVEAVTTTLRQAGAQVTSVTEILPGFLELKREDAAPVFDDFGFLMPIEGDVRGILASKLALRIAEGSPELPYRLRQLGVIGVEGDYGSRSDVVLLVGGTDSDLSSVNAVDVPIIRTLHEAGKRVIACEASADRLSCMRSYQRFAISTVDNADTAAGQLALVLVLAGAEGDFGVKKSTADHLLPPIPPAGR
jgi:hypothetical protein